MKHTVILILFFHCFALSYAQDEKLLDAEQIDQRIESAYALINRGDTEEALASLESALNDSRHIDYREGVLLAGKGLMKLFYQQGDFDKVITTDERIEEDIKDLKRYSDRATVGQLKGLAYMQLGLYDVANKEFHTAEALAELGEESNEKQYVKSLLFSSHAALHDVSDGPIDSIAYYMEMSVESLEKMDEKAEDGKNKQAQLAFQYMNLGEVYNRKGEPRKAEEYYMKSLTFYENEEETNIRDETIFYNELGHFYLGQNKNDKALYFLEKGLALEKKSSFPEVRRELYVNLSDLYLAEEELEKSKKYMELLNELSDSMEIAKLSAADENVDKLVNRAEAENKASHKKLLYILVGIFLIVLAVILTAWRIYNTKLQKNYRRIIERLKSEEDSVIPDVEIKAEEQSLEETPKQSTGITDDTLSEILVKLEKFENSVRFTNPDMSFPFLVNYLDTNAKYLSFILKEEKKKSFNRYINDLRVDYLIKQLYRVSKYRQYTVEALAEEAGFRSRSTFIKAFKTQTGLTPSYFIKKLKEEVEIKV